MNHETTILITGASGFLGRRLTARLADMATVVGVGHSNAAEPLVPLDLRELDALKGLLKKIRPDVVVHSAAYRDPDFCEDHPDEAYLLNVAPVERFCELLPASVPLLFISSDYVFDGVAPPYCEEDTPRPVNEYGRLKVVAENLILGREAGSVLRIPLLIGAGPTRESSGFVSTIVEQIQDPTPSHLDDAGIRFPAWTNDVAEAVAHLLNIGGTGIYHYSSLKGGTKYQWALELAELAGLAMDHIAPNREGVQSSAPRPGNTQLSVDKIKGTGFRRFTPFRDVAQSVLETLHPGRLQE